MKLIYTSQFIATFKPGDRIWVSAFRVAANCKRLVRNLPPVFCEVCATWDAGAEKTSRASGKDWVKTLIPVKDPDSQDLTALDFSRPINPSSDLNYCGTKAEAAEAYNQDLAEAKRKINITRDAIVKLGNRVAGIKEEPA